MSYTERVVALIDMDCFYCQVEENLDQTLVGKPIAVVQYNQWKGGGIIAVNYIAREKGVTRQMRGDEAKEKCPDIQLPRVPQVRGKADLTKYREAGKKVAEVLMSFTGVLERASIDEAYLDITEAVNLELKKGLPILSIEDLSNTFVVGGETSDFLSNAYRNQNSGLSDDDLKLAIGGAIIERIRAEVFKKTGYRCSAGIAHNKTLAKLVCSLHKPNKQTILPQHAVFELFAKLPIRKIKSLGGKFGHTLSEMLRIEFIGELTKFSEKELIQRFDEKNGKWLYNISRGIDKEAVQSKVVSKSIGCCKRFPGRTSLLKTEDVEHWIKELSSEISERLEEDLKENSRKARLITVSFSQETNQTELSNTRATPLRSYEMDKISQSAFDVIKKNCMKPDGSYHITFLGLSVGNFENVKNVRSITTFFKKCDQTKSTHHVTENVCGVGQHEKTIFPIENNKKSDRNNQTKEENCTKLYSNFEEEMDCVNNTTEDEKSNYSDSTIELDENPDDLIFYDIKCNPYDHPSINKKTDTFDVCEKKIENQNNERLLLQRNMSATSVDSLENEIYIKDLTTSNSPILNSGVQENGFFSKYFENKRENNPYNRNFDTSKIFEDNESSCSGDGSLDQELFVASKKSETLSTNFKSCEECGEKVSIDDLCAHMDYHLAIKISKENSPFKHDKPQTESKITNRNASKKRKANKDLGINITSFFKQEQIDVNEPTEVCSECNKSIKLIDIEMHSDYHAAKKLHLELNKSGSTNLQPKIKSSGSKNVKDSKGKNVKSGSIVTFFKKNVCE